MFLPEERLLTVTKVVSNVALTARPEIEHIALERMRREVAGFITQRCVEQVRDEFSTTYRMELYVLTPDQLAQSVQRAAWELQKYGPMRFPAPQPE